VIQFGVVRSQEFAECIAFSFVDSELLGGLFVRSVVKVADKRVVAGNRSQFVDDELFDLAGGDRRRGTC